MLGKGCRIFRVIFLKLSVWLSFCLSCLALSFSSALFAKVPDTSTHALLIEARQEKEKGDLSTAISLYQKILEIEENHPHARKELAALIIEAQMNEPYSEETIDHAHFLTSKNKNAQNTQNTQKE